MRELAPSRQILAAIFLEYLSHLKSLQSFQQSETMSYVSSIVSRAVSTTRLSIPSVKGDERNLMQVGCEILQVLINF